MHKKIAISLALLLLLLCSCAAGSGNSATPTSPTRTASALTLSGVPTSAVSATPSPTSLPARAVATPAPTRATVPLSQAGNTPAPFRVTSVDVSVSPASLSTWTCGSFIQVVYMATFHVVSGPAGGVMSFSYTTNNGRSSTPENLTIIPGQHVSSYMFTWQGALPSDHTQPGAGGVMVTSPNQVVSQMVAPKGMCR